MAVPQYARSLSRNFGRKGNMVRVRRYIFMTGRQYRGTVITVPYIAFHPPSWTHKKPGTIGSGLLIHLTAI